MRRDAERASVEPRRPVGACSRLVFWKSLSWVQPKQRCVFTPIVSSHRSEKKTEIVKSCLIGSHSNRCSECKLFSSPPKPEIPPVEHPPLLVYPSLASRNQNEHCINRRVRNCFVLLHAPNLQKVRVGVARPFVQECRIGVGLCTRRPRHDLHQRGCLRAGGPLEGRQH